jgi:6-pyruvoyltetrahydropterin/6-carboxytetrahydropterin synthase
MDLFFSSEILNNKNELLPLWQSKLMIYVTRKEHFNAAHKLARPEWTDEENEAVFGKCANTNWHGHNFNLYVTVKGEPNELTGFVIDLKVLSEIIREKVTEQLDHKNLNLDVPFMNGIMPSTENLAIAIWKQLEDSIVKHKCNLYCIKLFETENNFAEYFGPNHL